MTIPETAKLVPSTTRSVGSCRVHSCITVEENKIYFLVHDGLEKLVEHKFEVGGVINPRSFKETAQFEMSSLDIDAISHIDDGYKIGVAMTIPGEMTGFEAVQTNDMNGIVNEYGISFLAIIPVFETDRFTMTLPEEMGAPADIAAMDCKHLENVSEMECFVID